MHSITNGYKRFSKTNSTDPRQRVPLKQSHTGPDIENENDNDKNSRPRLVKMLHAEYTHTHSPNQGHAFLFTTVFILVIRTCVTWPLGYTSTQNGLLCSQ